MSDHDIKVDIKGDASGLKAASAQATSTLHGLQSEFGKTGQSIAGPLSASDRFIGSLRGQADTLGMTRGEIARYNAAQLGMTQSQAAVVRSLSQQIDAHDRNVLAMQRLRTTATVVGTAIAAAFAAASVAMVRATMETEQSTARLRAVLRATEYAAGLTRAELEDMVQSMEGKTLFDDDQIRDAASILLTFRNVQGDTFRAAMRGAADLAAVMKIDLSSAVLMLGKALEDPEVGLTALTRAGVSFSPVQREMIKNLVEQGREAEALALILKRLQGQVDGTAEGLRTGITASAKQLSDSWDDLLKSIGKTETVQGTVGFAFDTLSNSLRNMQGVVEDGDWLDRLSYFTAGVNPTLMMIRSMIPARTAKPSTGADPEAEKAREGRDRQNRARAEEQEQLRQKKAGEDREKERKAAAERAVERRRAEQQALQDMERMQIKKETETQTERTLWEIEKGRYRDFSTASQQRLLATAREIDADAEFQQALEASDRAVKEENAEYQRWLTSQKELGKRLFEETRTPAEQLAGSIAELQRLLQMGAIDWDTYSRSVDQAQDKFNQARTQADDYVRGIRDETDAMVANAQQRRTLLDGVYLESIGIQRGTAEWTEHMEKIRAVRDQQDRLNQSWEHGAGTALRDFLDETRDVASQTEQIWRSGFRGATEAITDFVFEGEAHLDRFFEDIGRQVTNMMVQQSIVAPIAAGIGGLFNFAGTGHAGAVIGVEHDGNRVVPASVFAGAPRHHTGTVLGRDEVPFIGKRGESVLTPAQMQQLAPVGAASRPVTINIQEAPGTAARVTTRPDQGGGMTIDVMIEQIEDGLSGRMATGRGNLSNTMERTYGLSRVAGAVR